LHAQAVERVIHYHNDALGSPIFATNQRGELVWRRSYTPYGEELNREAPNEPGYTGKLEEPDLGISDFGARWYDPRIGRFLAIDPVGFSPDNPQSFNRYAYANNNPYGFTDPDGRWASQMGAYVHQRATFMVIGKDLPRNEVRILAAAHVKADAPGFQGADSSFRHAMRNGDQTPGEARSAANTFVRDQFQKAWGAAAREEALTEFGIALHTLQDSTSPAHGGFQEWTGDETETERFEHIVQEVANPGEESELFKVTEDAWRWFNDRKLPDGDLFTRGVDP
ncbi:MAG: RHS repeat domain-containing protein, partial [Gammaproteobacteria bacterium]